jgi:hypothetical protein
MLETAGRSDAGRWQQLIARAGCPSAVSAGSRRPHLPSPSGDRDFLIADHGLSGPLLDLVTAVLALGEAM